jgi:GNAT superfamily N-acetyltransferase
MPAFSIRTARESDSAGIADLATQLGYPVRAAEIRTRLQTLLPSPADVVLVAETEGSELAGWLHGTVSQPLESGPRAEITGLVVAASWQRRGVGRALLQHLEQWAGRQGVSQVVVRCQTRRQEAHEFYAALGYQPAKTQTVFRKPLN